MLRKAGKEIANGPPRGGRSRAHRDCFARYGPLLGCGAAQAGKARARVSRFVWRTRRPCVPGRAV
jgi:hypothetical protein